VSARKKTWIGIGVGVLGLIALAKSLSLPMAASGAAAVALGLLIVALLEKIVFSPLDRLGQGVRALSGRKSLERALEVSEREKALILNAMSQRVVYQTPDHRVVWANRAAAESVNALPEELPGRRCYEIWQGRAEPCVDCPLDKTVQTGQPHEAEIASPDGRTWLTRSFPVQGENGALDGLMEVSRDVTAHKSAREALAYEQRLFSILTDNIPDNIYFKDTQSRFLRINRALAAYFGLSDPAESIGKTDADFFSEEHARQAFLDEQESIRSGLPLIGKEEKETWPSAEETWVSTTKVPFRDEKGGIIGIFGISRNITERKRAEQEREKLIAELEAKNAELERFTYTVSHDLKSPLITIKGFMGLLDQDLAAGHARQVKNDISRINDAAEKMQRLLDELLELSRIGRRLNPPEDVPLTALAHEAAELVAGQIAERGVEIEIDPDLPVVYGDRPRLLEVLQNLIDNAVKFLGDQARPRVEIGARQDGDQTVCFVRDNGIGIPARYHQRVFGLFDQLNQNSQGTGVGLALVKRIVEVHGGRIWIESEGEGCGCTFCFLIPRKGESAQNGN